MSALDPIDLMSGLVLESGKRWGEVAADFQVEDARAIFDASGPRWHFESRPRGGSKSTDAAGVGLVWLASEAPAGARAYIVAVDEDQAALDVDAASGLVDRTPALRSVVTVQSLKIVARSGASVEVLSADGASAFGLRPHLLIVEEFGQWPSTRGCRRLWTALLSAMGKVPGSRLVILTSAGEPGHFSHKVLQEARRSDRWRVSEVPGPLPWVDPAELEAQRPLLRDSEFARLHLNVWTQSEDRLVSAEDLEVACARRPAGATAPSTSTGSWSARHRTSSGSPSGPRHSSAASFLGREGVEKYFEELRDTWEEIRLVAQEFRDLGDRSLFLGRLEGRGRASGAPVESPFAAVFDFRGSQCSRIRAFPDHDEASRAASLTE